MAAKKPDLEQPMILLTFGYSTYYALPWTEGIQIMNLMKDAIPVETKYAEGKSTWHRTVDRGIRAEGFSPLSQAQVLMSGEPEQP